MPKELNDNLQYSAVFNLKIVDKRLDFKYCNCTCVFPSTRVYLT